MKNLLNTYKEDKKNNFKYLLKYKNFNIDCSKLIYNNSEWINYAKQNRLLYYNSTINTKCSEIYKRGFGTVNGTSNIEKKYSLAYARNIYNNYEIVELLLLAQYSKNNHYCYAVDSKYPDLYKKMIQLEKCLPNVYVTKKQFDFQSNGKFTSIGHYECMKLLLKKKWDYMFLLQMDDIVIKTNRQILEILEAINFSLDMAFTNEKLAIKKRVNFTLTWTYKDLNIFLKDDIRRNNHEIINKSIIFYKGLVPSGMKRETINYIVNKINITTYLNQLNSDLYGHDELTWQTLLTDDILNIPKNIPKKCVFIYYPRSTYLSRKVIWGKSKCSTNMIYHTICTWGVESLKNINKYTEIHGYRFKDSQDYGALKCWVNYMYQRNNFLNHENPNLWYYYNLPQSVFERKRQSNDYESINLCKL
ncbi:Glycosyl transferase, family 14-containing protein [Strongyloides ratti]|uniref:Glycosyl transferase, family 14-containing protein n=1 Tax=Strongyloides ratti TaxID=34506 RepID=A0A090LSA3_STRRB|nr:Glycosyl transferase, family 14-containing protein [Strongyloides ratti]CEF70483.1 Glycosyl transferase, family 14-containing protein [Strongyloides ratti]